MTRTVWVGMIAASALFMSPAFSQSKGGAPPPSTGGNTGAPTGTAPGGVPIGRPPGVTPTPNTTQQQPTRSMTVTQPIFLSGRVMTEDGTPPTGSVVIETVCNGVGHSEGYVDSKGYFAIELGQNRGVIQDASEFSAGNNPGFGTFNTNTTPTSGMNGSDMAMRKYMGCDLQAKVAGYRSQTVPLSGRRPMDDPDVGVILLHRLGGQQEEGRTVSSVSLAAPKDAKKAYEKGMDAIKKKKFADAQTQFEKAVEIYPNYSVAWYELGRLRIAEDKFDIARGSFDQAIKADPKFVLPYLQISILELQAKRWQELADITDKTIHLDAFDYPQAFFFNSVANFNLHNLEAAEKSAKQAQRLDTRNQFPKLYHLLGLILADRKDWTGAAALFKDYLRLAPKASDLDTVRTQLAQVEKLQEQVATAKDQ